VQAYSAHILEISDHLPINVEFIETREKVDAILPKLEKRTGSGLIEIQEATIIVPAKSWSNLHLLRVGSGSLLDRRKW
jgi:PII-like signaling protein